MYFVCPHFDTIFVSNDQSRLEEEFKEDDAKISEEESAQSELDESLLKRVHYRSWICG